MYTKGSNDTRNSQHQSEEKFADKNPSSPQLSEKEYEPYDNRIVKHPTNFFETFIHLLKTSLGTGILSMPYAFSNSGYVVGIIGTLVIGFLCTYSVHILISSEYKLCKKFKKPCMSYPETIGAAFSAGPEKVRRFSKYASIICNVFLLIYQLGTCSVYVLFIATNLKGIVDDYISTEYILDVRYYCIFILLPLLLLNSVKNYKYLAPLSTIGTIFTAISFVIISYYLFTDIPDLSNRKTIGSPEKIPLFVGTVIFAMEAIGIVFPLENEMANPQKFGSTFGVLNSAMVLICALYCCMGLFGYLRYGDEVPGTITLSLPHNNILSLLVKVMLTLSVFISHAVMLLPAFEAVSGFMKPFIKKKQSFWNYMIRVVMVFLTFTFAVAIPILELFISLVGALCLSMLGLFFPALIHTFTCWYNYNGAQFTFLILKNGVIFVVAVYSLIFGFITTLTEIIEQLMNS